MYIDFVVNRIAEYGNVYGLIACLIDIIRVAICKVYLCLRLLMQLKVTIRKNRTEIIRHRAAHFQHIVVDVVIILIIQEDQLSKPADVYIQPYL